MNYEEAVSYINELQMFARKHTLDHTRAFLSYLGTPQEKKMGKGAFADICRRSLLERGNAPDCLHPLI